MRKKKRENEEESDLRISGAALNSKIMERKRPTFKNINLTGRLSPLNEIYYQVPGFDKYYCTKSGRIYTSQKGRVKEVQGSKDKDGYLKVVLTRENERYYFRKHRIITLTFLGASELEVNHINGNKQDNRIKNLEYVTNRENQCHRRKKEGYNVGVCFDKKMKKYRAYIQHNKRWMHLGFFPSEEEAKKAYIKKIKDLGIKNRYAYNGN